MGEQIVAGADEAGDVLVICGTTLITWAVMGEEWIEQPGLWTIRTPPEETRHRRPVERWWSLPQLGMRSRRRRWSNTR